MTSLSTTAANAAGSSASNRVSLLTTDATSASDHMPRSSLGMNEEISEDEARRRREQLNRRPSYRMILKDLETCQSGDTSKSMKRELTADGIIANQRPTSSNEGGKPPSYEHASALSNGGGSSGTLMGAPSSLILRNLTQAATTTAAASLLQVSTAAAAAMAQRNALNNMIPPLPRLLGGGIGSGCGGTVSSAGGVNGSSGCDIPSQPQPQLINTLTAANTNPMLSAVAAAILPSSNDIAGHFPSSHNNVDWQSSLLSGYQNNSANSSFSGALSGMSSGGGAPIGLTTRQGSASLTSLSDNNDNNDGTRKRQVRLLKNREAAKECRRKKKEYVKCLENRVAVLENQNKALIEELKTLKELYCRKEKTELQ